jgi:hypothetical protein
MATPLAQKYPLESIPEEPRITALAPNGAHFALNELCIFAVSCVGPARRSEYQPRKHHQQEKCIRTLLNGYEHSPITNVHLKNYIFDNVEKLNRIGGTKNAVLKNVKD